MSDAAIFSLFFGGLLILRVIAATIVFVLILPRGDHCPICDARTVRVHSPILRRSGLRLTKRWCLACGWEGVMRLSPSDKSSTAELTKGVTSAPSVSQPSRRL